MGRFLRGLGFALTFELGAVFFFYGLFAVDGPGFMVFPGLVIALAPTVAFLIVWHRYAVRLTAARPDRSPAGHLLESLESSFLFWLLLGVPSVMGATGLLGAALVLRAVPSVGLEGLLVAGFSFAAVPLAAVLGRAMARTERALDDENLQPRSE